MLCTCAILPSVAWPALKYFCHIISQTARFFEKKYWTKILSRVSLQLLSETFFMLRRTGREMIKCVYWSYIKYPLFLSDVSETWISSTNFRKTLKYQISWKSVQWKPSCSVRTGGRTDMTKLIVAFRNFANAPKNQRKLRWMLDVGYEI